MNTSSRNAGRIALADFFFGLHSQRGHWYNIIASTKIGSMDETINKAFPPLGKLASVDEDMMRNVLVHCGLIMFCRGSGYSVLMQQWQSFLLEYQLSDTEVTHFTIAKKKYIFLRLGSWNSISHKARTPAEIWSAALSRTLRVPRVCTSLLSRTLAERIGSLEIDFSTENTSTKMDDECSVSSDSDGTLDEDKKPTLHIQEPINVPDESEYPLLSSLALTHKGHNLFDRLLNEIVRYYGKSNISFTRGNNTEAALIAVPSFRSLARYDKELKKQDSFLDAVVAAIEKNCDCTLNDASETILSGMFHKYQDSFLSVAASQGVATHISPKVMDEVSVEAMLNEAGVNWTNGRIIFRHLKQFFGRSLVVSEKKRREYFGSNDFPPEVGRETLPEKTVITFWWKSPDLLLMNQINVMVKPEDLEGVKAVDLCIGGDHGAGRFRMLLKILLRFTSKPAIVKRYEVANVLHSKDDIDVLHKTVLEKIIEGLRKIYDGGRFIVTMNEDRQLNLSFSHSMSENLTICDVPIRLFINGDLKYFAQMLGREGMSTSWCMWCEAHPNQWSGLFNVPMNQLWSISKQQQFVQLINTGQLKEARDKKGIVSLPLIDFIEPQYYIFPQLHFEIGTVNNILDALRGFIEEEVEVLSDAEKAARNAKIIADVSYVKAKDKYDVFSSTGGSVELKLFRLEKVRVNQSLRDRNLSVENRNSLLLEREELDDAIASLLEEQKRLKEDAASRRKSYLSAAKAYKELQQKKSKSDTPIVATVENVLLGYNISPARYHGGKLNGVDCRALMSKAKSIIPEIEAVLHAIEHPHRCSSQTIEQRCKIYRDILVTLDFIASKIRIKQGQLKDADLHDLR